MAALRPGDAVEVFFRHGYDKSGSFPIHDVGSAQMRPRVAFSDGWVPARVLEACAHRSATLPASRSVPVCHTHLLWSNRKGDLPTQEELTASGSAAAAAAACSKSTASAAAMLASAAGCDGSFPECDVRRIEDSEPPLLSLIVVRWGGEVQAFDDQWGAISSSVSDRYIEAFLDAVYACLGPRFEVLSIFIESGADLSRVEMGSLKRRLSGRHAGACYFLWPTLAQEGTSQQMGMVSSGAVFRTMRQAEAAGLPTRFPHASQLYALLLSKEWQAQLCLSKPYAIPPTALVNRASISADPQRAASAALATLARTRTQPSSSRSSRSSRDGDASISAAVHRLAGKPGTRLGVAKLGHAWEAAHVRVFAGEAELATALAELTQQVGCECASVIVQDYVPNDFEMRVYVVRGVVRHVINSSFGGFDEHGCAYNFLKKSRSQAITEWLAGDEAAMEHAERRVQKLVQRWLAFLGCVAAAHEPSPAIRMDFLIRRSGVGRARVHTLELTELGFSLLGWEEGPRVVLTALLESCFDDTGASADEADLLRAYRDAGPAIRAVAGLSGHKRFRTV